MSKQKNFILLRGLTRESRHWGDFPQMLKEHYPQSQIIELDLPGAGVLSKERCPLSVSEITCYLRDLVDPLLLNKKNIIFVGVSLGGMVAMKWADLFPQDLSEVVVINSSAGSLAPFWQRLKPSAVVTLLRTLINPEKQHSIIFDRVCRRKENKQKTIELWEKIHQESPVSLKNAQRQITAAAAFKLNFPISQRGLVLTSDGDDLVSSQCSQKISSYLNWPLKKHPWAGHELPDDDPQWVIKEIRNFID